MKEPLSVSAAIEFYLATRRRLGFALVAEGRILASLARYARQNHHRGPLTTDLVLRWAQLPQEAGRLWWARRWATARQFAHFWVAFDSRTQVPPAGFFGPWHRRPPPHIYTQEELDCLLSATAGLGPAQGARARTLRTLVGLLACTGLRVGEALRLAPQDLDLAGNTLWVQAVKSSPARRLPVHPSLIQALSQYNQWCQQNLGTLVPRPALFLNSFGLPLSSDAADRAFRQLCDQLGWTQPPVPRLYDLRHTFALNWLVRWNRQPGLVGSNILALSAYLGHRRVTDTYWYLSAVPQLLSASNARFEQRIHSTITPGPYE